MARHVVTWSALACAVAVVGCSADTTEESCAEQAASACATAPSSVQEKTSDLTLGDLRAGRWLEVFGAASPREGSVAGSSPDDQAVCHGGDCAARFDATVTFKATPARGYVFSQWSGCSQSKNAELTLTHLHGWQLCWAHFSTDTRPTFDALGQVSGYDANYANDVSADGQVVVGFSHAASGDVATRWTAGDQLVSLGGIGSRANAISADGKLIVGHTNDAAAQLGAIWRPGEVYSVLVAAQPSVSAGAIYLFVDATDVLSDGRVFGTCTQKFAYGDPLGCLLQNSSATLLSGSSIVYAGDSNTHFAGLRRPAHGESQDFHDRAVYDGAVLDFPADANCLPPTTCTSEARAFSADGGVIVGNAQLPAAGAPAYSALLNNAIVHTQVEGTVRLSDLAGGDDSARAFAVSADGKIIAGSGTDAGGHTAVVWIDRTPLALSQLFAAAGGTLPAGFKLLEVRAITPDARVFVGNGSNAVGAAEAFRIVFPATPTR
ncbi:MAG: extracellular repeat protein family [Myxococcaceae bacterium]|nr:extracellular repeat protein family [Myxococcaceae bacterium]